MAEVLRGLYELRGDLPQGADDGLILVVTLKRPMS